MNKKAKFTRTYGPMYLDLDDYTPYSDVFLDFFEMKINFNLRLFHGYPIYTESYKKNSWVDKKTWENFETTF